MASFRKRGGKWQAQVRKKGFASVSRSFRRKSDAQRWANQIESNYETSSLPPVGKSLEGISFSALLVRYRAEITPKKRSRYQEGCRIARILKHPIANLSASSLTTGQFARYRDDRLRTVGAQTVRHDLNLMGHVIKVATSDWDIPFPKNPVSEIRKPIPPLGRERRLIAGEANKMRAACLGCRSTFLWPIVEFALETAMRRGEILNLDWEFVDLGRGIAVLPLTKNGSKRTVPLSLKARSILKDVGVHQHGLVFPVGSAGLRMAWDRMVRRAGIEGLHFHDLRHEAISRLFEKGLSLPEVALISGHRDFRVLARYTHLRADDIVAKLD